MKQVKKTAGDWVLYYLLIIIILTVWGIVSRAGVLKPYTMPTLSREFQTLWKYTSNGQLFTDLIVSIRRVLQGFMIALVCALSLGIAVGLWSKVEVFTDLVVQVLRPIPPIAWIPLAILWLGIGEESKIFIIFIGAFFPILLNTVTGIRNIEERYTEMARTYEVPRGRFVLQVVLPGALPNILAGFRLGLSNAWICVVAAEMIASISGIGHFLENGRDLSRPDEVILGMLVIGLVGKVMDDILLWINRKIVRWE